MLFGSSVELLVYHGGGSGMPLHKINNTPHRIRIYLDDICLYTVMSVCIAYSLCNEISQISTKE